MAKIRKIRLFYLRSWAGYMKYANHLDVTDRNHARVFFRALKQLEKEEVSLLRDKYVSGEWNSTLNESLGVPMNQKPVSDSILATRLGITLQEYREKRLQVEGKLRMTLYEQLNNDDKQALDGFYLTIGNLYLESFNKSGIDIEIKLTTQEEKARVCTQEEEELLLAVGSNKFERVSTWQ